MSSIGRANEYLRDPGGTLEAMSIIRELLKEIEERECRLIGYRRELAEADEIIRGVS